LSEKRHIAQRECSFGEKLIPKSLIQSQYKLINTVLFVIDQHSEEKHQTETLAKARDHKHRRDRYLTSYAQTGVCHLILDNLCIVGETKYPTITQGQVLCNDVSPVNVKSDIYCTEPFSFSGVLKY